jgi:hypothetical protein
MTHTPDTTAAENGGNFDPRQAADLLDQATQQARRTFAPGPPPGAGVSGPAQRKRRAWLGVMLAAWAAWLAPHRAAVWVIRPLQRTGPGTRTWS